MKKLGKIAPVIVAFALLAVFASPLAVSATSYPGAINAQMTAMLTAPLVTGATGPATVLCTPLASTAYSLSVTVQDDSGWAQVASVSCQFFKGTTAYGAPVVSTAGTQQSTNVAHFTVPMSVQYYWPSGPDWTIQVVATDTAAQTSPTYTNAGFSYTAATAFVVNTGNPIAFGSLQLGGLSAIQQVTMSNAANSPTSIHVIAQGSWTSTTTGGPVSATTLTAGQGTIANDMNMGIGGYLFAAGYGIGKLPIGGTSAPTPQLTSWQEQVPGVVAGGFLGNYGISIDATAT